MKVKVSVKLDSNKLKFLAEMQKKAIELTCEAVLSDIKTSEVVPKDTGTLEDSGFVDLTEINYGVCRIIFDTPYARRMYWHPEYNFRHDKNINAQGKWMQTYIDGSKQQFVINTYEKFMKQLSKGLIY